MSSLFFVKGPAADATDTPQPWGLAYCATLWWRWLVFFFVFPCNGAPEEWNWQGKTEVLGEEPVPVPLCPPQILHGLTRDRTRTSAMRGRRLIAWAMARPHAFYLFLIYCWVLTGNFRKTGLNSAWWTYVQHHCYGYITDFKKASLFHWHEFSYPCSTECDMLYTSNPFGSVVPLSTSASNCKSIIRMRGLSR
jgi:hypothetical protein